MQQLDHYRAFRAIGYRAAESLCAARTLTAWEHAVYENRVRIRTEPETEDYFGVYGEPDTAREREQICASLSTHGCHCVITEYWAGAEWEIADSIGFCIYPDPLDPLENAYVPDMIQSALDHWSDAR